MNKITHFFQTRSRTRITELTYGKSQKFSFSFLKARKFWNSVATNKNLACDPCEGFTVYVRVAKNFHSGANINAWQN